MGLHRGFILEDLRNDHACRNRTDQALCDMSPPGPAVQEHHVLPNLRKKRAQATSEQKVEDSSHFSNDFKSEPDAGRKACECQIPKARQNVVRVCQEYDL